MCAGGMKNKSYLSCLTYWRCFSSISLQIATNFSSYTPFHTGNRKENRLLNEFMFTIKQICNSQKNHKVTLVTWKFTLHIQNIY